MAASSCAWRTRALERVDAGEAEPLALGSARAANACMRRSRSSRSRTAYSSCGSTVMAWRKSSWRRSSSRGEQRVTVELDAAQAAAAEARAAARRDDEAGRARQLLRDAILQREKIAGGAVDLGAADDDAGLHVDEARGQPHVAADALIGAGGDERGADELADGDGARHVDFGARLQRCSPSTASRRARSTTRSPATARRSVVTVSRIASPTERPCPTDRRTAAPRRSAARSMRAMTRATRSTTARCRRYLRSQKL